MIPYRHTVVGMFLYLGHFPTSHTHRHQGGSNSKFLSLENFSLSSNDRGRLLTNGELLRAKTLESLRNNLEMQLQAEQCWDDILQDDEKTTDQILEWCYISFTGKEVQKNPSLFHQYIENYFVEAKKRHINDEEMLSLMEKISNLKKDVIICRLLQTGTWPFMSDTRALWQKHRLHELVCRLRHTKAIPVLSL